MIHDRILSGLRIEGPETRRGVKEDIMDYIIVETIIVSAALAASVLKTIQLIVMEIAEDVREVF